MLGGSNPIGKSAVSDAPTVVHRLLVQQPRASAGILSDAGTAPESLSGGNKARLELETKPGEELVGKVPPEHAAPVPAEAAAAAVSARWLEPLHTSGCLPSSCLLKKLFVHDGQLYAVSGTLGAPPNAPQQHSHESQKGHHSQQIQNHQQQQQQQQVREAKVRVQLLTLDLTSLTWHAVPANRPPVYDIGACVAQDGSRLYYYYCQHGSRDCKGAPAAASAPSASSGPATNRRQTLWTLELDEMEWKLAAAWSHASMEAMSSCSAAACNGALWLVGSKVSNQMQSAVQVRNLGNAECN